MSWDEKLFRASLGAAQKLLRRKKAPAPEDAHQILLEDISSRLKVLASALAGQAMEIKEAESVGGPVGDTLFLPASLAVAPSVDLNRQAYLYRVAYSITLMQLGLTLPERFREAPEAQLLMSLLAVPLARAKLVQALPGISRIEPPVLKAEVERRLREAPTTQRLRALNKLALALLGVEPPANSWAAKALQAAPADPSGLEAATLSLLPELLRLAAGRESPLPIAPSIWGLILPPSKAITATDVTQGAPPTSKEGSLPTGTEKKGKPKESVEEVKISEEEQAENPLVHSFEKVKTADDYIGGKKMLDGADELEEQLEAIRELDLRKIIRTREKTESIYKADVMLESGVGDVESSPDEEVPQFYYDEWDFVARQYKKNWCKVFIENQVKGLTPQEVQDYVAGVRSRNSRQIRDLRRQFEEFTFVRRWTTRQPDGPEIDMDAVVDRYATLKSGHSPNNLLYLSQRPKERDYATLVLLDSSLSTDSWLKNQRVMDVMKEAMLVLGEVITEYQDRMAIGAFHSNTRKDVRYLEIKRFDESWARAQARLVGLRPTGYTRIGPALRHGTHLLRQVQAKKKLLLLISDGKPTDYDRYEGRYGIEDIRQAIRDAAKEQIAIRALAIEAQAKFYLPRMFGAGNFQILPNPGMLAKSLAEIYGWLNLGR